MLDFFRTQNTILNQRVEKLESDYSKVKDYLDYLIEKINEMNDSMIEISSEEYLEFKKLKGRDKRIKKLLEEENEI